MTFGPYIVDKIPVVKWKYKGWIVVHWSSFAEPWILQFLEHALWYQKSVGNNMEKIFSLYIKFSNQNYMFLNNYFVICNSQIISNSTNDVRAFKKNIPIQLITAVSVVKFIQNI